MRRLALVLATVALLGGRRAPGQATSPDSVRAVARQHFWVRPVASFVLPGSGQFMAHQSRAAAYVAIEVYAILRYLQLSQQGRTAATQYRDIALQVARRNFSPSGRDTVFEYYETMERFLESGQYTRGTGAALVPESDTSTYNGSVWLLARRTYWRDPGTPPDPSSAEYLRATEFYKGHAVGPGYLWSWRDGVPDLVLYRTAIEKSDDAFRSAQDKLGLLLANHVASAVDALISSRIAAAAHRPAAIHTTLGPGAFAVELSLGF
jgi:hypothetical protein